MKKLWIALVAAPLFTACLEDGAAAPPSAQDLQVLQTRISDLEARLAALDANTQDKLSRQSAQLEQLNVSFDRRLATEEAATSDHAEAIVAHSLKLEHVRVEQVGGKPTWIFQGVNVQLRNASSNEVADGTGNLLMGMNALPATSPTPVRTGSYNIVFGSGNAYERNSNLILGNDNVVGSGNLIVGDRNTSSSTGNVLFGDRNNATAWRASVLGGTDNRVNGMNAVIVGGRANSIGAGSTNAVIGGGLNNAIGGNYVETTIGGGSNLVGKYPGSFSP